MSGMLGMQPLDVDFSSSWSSLVVLQLKEGLEIFQRLLETIENEYFLFWLSYHTYCLSAVKLLVFVAVTL